MRNESHTTRILTLANMLVGKQVETTIISDALAFICRAFAFDGGLIYEIDQSDYLCLNEYFMLHKIPLPERFAVTDISSLYRKQLAEETVSYIHKNAHNSTGEQQIQHIFSAEHLTIVSAIDHEARIFGLIVFFNTQSRALFSDADTTTLTVLLSMFSRYLEARLYQNKLSFAQKSLENLLDSTGLDIYVNDFYTHETLYVNKTMAAPYGGISQFLGRKCWQVLFAGQGGPCEFCPQKHIIDADGNPTKVYVWNYQRAFDGLWFRVFSAAFRWVDGRLAHVVCSADITENKQNEALIEYMANYDALTKLPNRRKLLSECSHRLGHITAGEKGYLLFFDIDGFKAINDTLGHDAGDEFLVQLGTFFSEIPMLKDSMYRNGGDEFVAILDCNASKENVRTLVGFIHKRLTTPWILQKGPVLCNTSVGVACYPDDGTTPEELLHKADQAMYHTKKAGGGALCFHAQLTSELPAQS